MIYVHTMLETKDTKKHKNPRNKRKITHLQLKGEIERKKYTTQRDRDP